MEFESDARTEQVPFFTSLLLVFVGGAIGTLARALLIVDLQHTVAEFGMLLAINVVGSFALGALSGWVGARMLSPRNQNLRALLGTGLIGGFTSYSALALLVASDLFLGTVYAALSIVLGVLVAWFGLLLGQRLGERGAAA